MPRFFRLPWRSRAAIARDVDAELAFHLEMRVQALVAEGHAPDAARQIAGDEFGDLQYTRAYCRDLDERGERATRLADHAAEWRQDARYAWRGVRRNPAFTAVSLLTLLLAIGANTAIFSVTRAVLLKPLPYRAPDSLVAVYESPAATPTTRWPLSAPNVIDYRASARALAGLAAYTDRAVTWHPPAGDPELIDVLAVTGNTFALLGARPLLGRALVPADEAPGAGAPVVLSHAFWQRTFGGDPTAVGRTITLNGAPHAIVGVMPATFTLGERETMWLPLDLAAAAAEGAPARKQHYLRVIGRLAPNVTVGAAAADLRAISRRLAAAHPDANTDRLAALVPLHADTVGDLRPALLLLQAAAGLVLLIACVNLANVTLSRTVGRRRELAVRAAIGAGRGRLVRQLLAESVLLALVGGALGTGLAVVATRTLLALNPEALPPLFDPHVDGTVLAFGLALSVATGALFGLLPAVDAARADLQGALRDGGRGTSGGVRGERARRALVVAQVGLAVVLLVGAGLLVRSFGALTRVRVGFETDRVLTAQVRVAGARYDSAAAVDAFFERVLAEIRRAPGVVAVGGTMKLPTTGKMYSTVVVEGAAVDPTRAPEAGYTIVRGDYFQLLGIPLRAGRTFDARDRAGVPGTVIVNETAARTLFPGGVAIGRRVRLGPYAEAPWATVVGVVGDIRDEAFDVPPGPAVYASHAQNGWWRALALTVRTAGDPRSAEAAVRRAVRLADPQIAVRDVRTLDDVVGAALAARRFALGLVSSFAVVALALAAVGIYGVLAFSVTSRTREYGVRLALGATRRGVLLLVVRQGVAWALLGLALGVAGAAAGGRLLDGMLYGVGPTDATTFAGVALALLAVVLLSCAVPAARATRVDPITSVRAE